MRERIGPVACFRDARVVERLPKTRSGKVLRGMMREIAGGRDDRAGDDRRSRDPRRNRGRARRAALTGNDDYDREVPAPRVPDLLLL